jgi:hypothetical protein
MDGPQMSTSNRPTCTKYQNLTYVTAEPLEGSQTDVKSFGCQCERQLGRHGAFPHTSLARQHQNGVFNVCKPGRYSIQSCNRQQNTHGNAVPGVPSVVDHTAVNPSYGAPPTWITFLCLARCTDGLVWTTFTCGGLTSGVRLRTRTRCRFDSGPSNCQPAVT